MLMFLGSYMEWYLNSYHDKTALLNAVDNLPYRGGGTSTWLALDDLVDVSFTVCEK